MDSIPTTPAKPRKKGNQLTHKNHLNLENQGAKVGFYVE